MKFSRLGRIKFLSHLDFMTLFHRTAVRAGVPIAFSQGFNPHPKIAFGPALSVGMESLAEYLDMETDPFIDLIQMTKALNSALPDGIRVQEARLIPKKAASLSGSIGRYMYEVGVPPALATDVEVRTRAFLARETVIVEKDDKQKDIRPGVESIVVKGPALLEVTVQDSEKAKPRIQDVIEKLFDIGHDQAVLFNIKRTAMLVKENGTWQSPMDVT
jgi:radical SAM-linked protein